MMDFSVGSEATLPMIVLPVTFEMSIRSNGVLFFLASCPRAEKEINEMQSNTKQQSLRYMVLPRKNE
jgi:hypothetical protein